MKKLFMMAAMAVAMMGTAAHAQKKEKTKEKEKRGAISYTTIGPVLGLGHSWLTNGDGVSRKFNFAPSIGVGLLYSRNEHWGWGGELMASREGEKYEYTDATGNHTISDRPVYLRIPLHVSYFFGKYGDNIRPKVYLGPTFGIKLNERFKVDDESSVSVSGNDAFFKTFDFGLNAGAGVNIKMAKRTWLNLDAGYYYGFLNADKDAGDSFHNSNIRLNIGVMFGL